MKKIGRYEIEGVVAEGAMAVVYKARDPEIDRTVAVKVLKDELGLDEEHVNRFLREAKAAGSISHPNIVTIYDVGRIDNTCYITMEFLDKKSLADVLAEDVKLSRKEILSIGIQLARALDVAHRKGIVHRDIKPANILLAGSGETVKITDFGIAWLDRPEDVQRTHAGTVLGTPRYMSPEQARGHEADGRSDLFSLGVILYELLSGKKAFDSNNVASLMLQISLMNPTPLKTLVPDIPEGLQRVITKAMNKLPEKRYQTGAKLADALERELAVVMALEARPKRNQAVPLHAKFAALAAGIVALFTVLSMVVMAYVESRVMEARLINSGTSLTKALAGEIAVPLLAKDTLPLEWFVTDEAARGTFDYLVVTDRQNLIKASTDKSSVGKPFMPPRSSQIAVADPKVAATSTTLPSGDSAILFDSAVLFQNTDIGRLYLGVSKVGMQSVVRSTLFAMAMLGLASAFAAGGLCFLFGGMIARSIRLVRNSLMSFGSGDFDRRIAERRNDEIGELFTAFNHMADCVQAGRAQRDGDGAVAAMLPTPYRNRLLAVAAAADAESTLIISPELAAAAEAAEAAEMSNAEPPAEEPFEEEMSVPDETPQPENKRRSRKRGSA